VVWEEFLISLKKTRKNDELQARPCHVVMPARECISESMVLVYAVFKYQGLNGDLGMN